MQIADLLIQFYGLTTDIRECGFIAPDGRMLDFSGRHKGNPPSIGKWVEHFDFFGMNKEGFSLEEFFDMYPFNQKYPLAKIMDCCNLVKFAYDARTVSSIRVPTDEQLKIIESAFGESWSILCCIDSDSYIKDDFELSYTTAKSVKSWFEKAVNKNSTNVHTLTLENLYGTGAKLYDEYY